jgi:hypothetical protein
VQLLLPPGRVSEDEGGRVRPEGADANANRPAKGNGMTIIEKLQKNHADFSRKVEKIRSDWTRSEEAKRQDLQAAYEEAQAFFTPSRELALSRECVNLERLA